MGGGGGDGEERWDGEEGGVLLLLLFLRINNLPVLVPVPISVHNKYETTQQEPPVQAPPPAPKELTPKKQKERKRPLTSGFFVSSSSPLPAPALLLKKASFPFIIQLFFPSSLPCDLLNNPPLLPVPDSVADSSPAFACRVLESGAGVLTTLPKFAIKFSSNQSPDSNCGIRSPSSSMFSYCETREI